MSFVVRLEVDKGDAISDSGLRLDGEQKTKMLVYCPHAISVGIRSKGKGPGETAW